MAAAPFDQPARLRALGLGIWLSVVAVWPTRLLAVGHAHLFWQPMLVLSLGVLAVIRRRRYGWKAAVGQSLLLFSIFSVAGWLLGTGFLLLTAMALSGAGFFLAWKINSVQGFHGVMSLLLIPMWLLSGSLFPFSGASGWMQVVMRANPLTYGVAGFRRVLDWQGQDALPSAGLSLGVLAACALLGLGLSVLAVGRK